MATNRVYRVAVIPFKEVLGERARLTLWLLMAAAAFVLIISAANVANIILASLRDGEDPAAVANDAKKAAQERWRTFADPVFADCGSVIRADIWNEQVGDVVEVVVGQQDRVDASLLGDGQAASQAARVDSDRVVDQEGSRAALRVLMGELENRGPLAGDRVLPDLTDLNRGAVRWAVWIGVRHMRFPNAAVL